MKFIEISGKKELIMARYRHKRPVMSSFMVKYVDKRRVGLNINSLLFPEDYAGKRVEIFARVVENDDRVRHKYVPKDNRSDDDKRFKKLDMPVKNLVVKERELKSNYTSKVGKEKGYKIIKGESYLDRLKRIAKENKEAKKN